MCARSMTEELVRLDRSLLAQTIVHDTRGVWN